MRVPSRLFLVAILVFTPFADAAERRPREAAVASAHPAATAAGREIIEAGGNAFDAAVAVAAALAVVEPYSSGLGGGGFFLLHRARERKDVVLDARERAPAAARRDMYLDAQGRPVPRASLDGPLAAGIPGVPAALEHLARRYGSLPLERTLAPAIALATDGFAVTPRYRRMAEQRQDALRSHPAAGDIFVPGGFVPEPGERIVQADLARTLKAMARDGARGFYGGEVGRRLVAGVRAGGGIWRAKDLEDYRVIEREPLEARYRGQRVVTAPPPSAGGVALLQVLGVLEGFELEGLDDATRAHILVEAMRRAFRDRAHHLGDPDFLEAGVTQGLLAPAYIGRMRAGIDRRRVTPSERLGSIPVPGAGTHTTHLSVIDTQGNRVAATLSINTPFGSAFVPPGTGVLLNNEMDDFATAPGLPNTYGLVGSEANGIAPGKRPLSSMTPTFVETRDTVAVLGTPGGSRIVSMVLLATLDVLHGRGGPADWVARPRFHHQYLPDVIEHEPGAFEPDTRSALARFGHRLRAVEGGYGNMQIVAWDRRTGRAMAAADPRGEGAVWAGAVRSGESGRRSR
ncbi:gamma-glutamyltransferase [Sulfurifustis variabilis]|uniref:Glutathione hydrolase proenzyme n=1 Tax=Sulfurifustis variabilis TaxID=1675686 RepID=A0A1B4V0T0_9GAMM|nr:gamma-glutamyltransferase [Sulfurifustis variabilis]BAU47070.1 gamma-glutamyltransferase [Sulfurifustis variabilis]